MAIPDESPLEAGSETIHSDAASRQEETTLTDKQYEGIKKSRRSDFHKHVHIVSILILYGAFIVYGLAAIVWLVHLIGLPEWHFMSKDNYNTLQSLLFGTIIGGLASQFARKVFD